MRLEISNAYNKEFTDDVCRLATSMLKMKAVHLFIASHVWESITLELSDEIPECYLSCMNMCCANIKVKLPSEVTYKTLQLLCDLYPDRAGKLRKAFMTQRPLGEVIGECLV